MTQPELDALFSAGTTFTALGNRRRHQSIRLAGQGFRCRLVRPEALHRTRLFQNLDPRLAHPRQNPPDRAQFPSRQRLLGQDEAVRFRTRIPAAVAGQSQIFIAAPVRTGAAEALAALLETMNAAPGTADPANALLPFGRIPTIHVARFVILDDPSLPDRQQIAPQLPATEPLRLAFIADCDGTADDLLRTLVDLATPGLQQIFSHCSDFDAHTDLLAWLHAHRIVSAATYANWPGRSMTQVREEATLHAALRQTRLAHPEASPEQLRDILLTATRSVPLTPLPVPTFAEKLAQIGDFLLLPLYALLLSPLLIPALPFLILLLRWRETHDPVLAPVPSIARNKLLSSIEDRDVTNQYSAIGSLKPGLFRRWLTVAVLWIINWGGRHLFNTGRLGRVNTIHFASWTFLDDKRRLFFGSNYDGSREAYNDDFINKVAFGLNVSFSNGLGYPQTNWLIFDGARHEQDFKRYLFHHQIPTQVWAHRKPDRLRAKSLDRGDMRMAANDEAADIQALADRGFSSLTGACYLLLRIENPALAKPWLRTLDIASVAQARAQHLPQVYQIAFTAAGLRALGTEVTPGAGFDPQFIDGIAGDERRSHQLGDEGANAPAHWHWGVGEQEPHILLLLLAANTAIDSLAQATCSAAQAAGCAVISGNTSTTTTPLGREPFGFADGVSQPDYDWGGTLTPGGARDRDYRNLLAMGELLLGYPNEYGFIGDYPQADELGRNGSYLVYRQLAQDVAGFWQWLARQAGDGAIALAERMVGRELDGAPLPGLESATIMGTDDPRNAFQFAEDPDGRICPIGAHIRRVNPRSGDDPQGRHGFLRDLISSVGFSGTAMHDAVASARFHRLFRRGRPYGPVIVPQAAMQGTGADQETGLHFVCLNANLARQFEFAQGAWAASAKFAGLAAEQDPLLGNRLPLAGAQPSDAFSYTDTGACPRAISGLPQFVTVRGGAYLFLPGLRGLAQILGDS